MQRKTAAEHYETRGASGGPWVGDITQTGNKTLSGQEVIKRRWHIGGKGLIMGWKYKSVFYFQENQIDLDHNNAMLCTRYPTTFSLPNADIWFSLEISITIDQKGSKRLRRHHRTKANSTLIPVDEIYPIRIQYWPQPKLKLPLRWPPVAQQGCQARLR